MCRNEATLGMAHADTVVLDMIEGEILDTRYIDELLALVDNAPDTTAHLAGERNRLQREIDNLAESIRRRRPGCDGGTKDSRTGT